MTDKKKSNKKADNYVPIKMTKVSIDYTKNEDGNIDDIIDSVIIMTVTSNENQQNVLQK